MIAKGRALQREVRRRDVIKVCATGGVLSLTDPADIAQLTQEELNAIVDKRTRSGRRPRRTLMARKERSGRFAQASTPSSTVRFWTTRRWT